MELNSLLTDLVKVMKEDRELFSKNTLELFEDSLKSYYKIAAKSVWFGNENISGIIQKTILNSENPKLDWRCISYTKQGLPHRPYEDVQRDHESIYLPLENKVIKDYWQDKSKAELYRQLSAFDPFVEYVIGANDWMKYIRHIFLLNDQGWLKYYRELIRLFFPQFEFDKQRSSAILRFTKLISPDLSICLEYDEKQARNELKYGLAPSLKLETTVLTNNFQRSTKASEYRQKAHPDIRTVCLGEHPVFFEPCTPPHKMSSLIANLSKNQGIQAQRSMIGCFCFENLSGGKMKLFNCNKDDGELLKKHAFFYMDIYSHYLNSYLDFLISCLNKVIIDK